MPRAQTAPFVGLYGCWLCGKLIHARNLCNAHYRRDLKKTKPRRPCGCGCGELTHYGYKWGHHTRLFTNEEQARRASYQDGSALRDTGAKKTYRKWFGRHEHRVVMEKIIGRPLTKEEVVHHKDHNKRNNSPDNLELMDRAEHARHHLRVYWEGRKNA